MNIQDKPTSLSLLGNIKPFVLNSTASVSFLLKKGDTVVVEQTYDPSASGVITIDIKDVIAGYLEYQLSDLTTAYAQPKIVGAFSAVIDGGAPYNFTVVRAGVDKLSDTASNFLTSNWLTWQPQIKAVTYSSPEYLTYYAVVSCKAILKATMQDDSVRTIDLISMLAGTAYTIPCQYATISTQLGGALPKYYDIYTQDGTGNRLSYIQRYYPSSFLSEQEQWILFENSLGGLDTFRAYGQMDFEGAHTHNIAEIDEIATEYRIDTERKFKKNTGHIDEYDRRWLLDFFPSRGKYIYTGSSLRRIVVTESNVTYVDKELPSAFEFTYKYADSTPYLNLQRTDALPADITISIPEAGSFTVPPRLIDYPRLPITEGALFPVQSPFDEKWGTTTAGALGEFFRQYLAITAGNSGNTGHSHSNMAVLNGLSIVEEYLIYKGFKIKAGYADKAGEVDGYLSKVKEDAAAELITFLKGIKAEGKSTIEELEVINGYIKELTADKTTTINLIVTELAKLYDLEVSHVATLFRTIVKDFISSEHFKSGFEGEGMKLYRAINGDWNLEIDNALIRKSMTIFELIISKIRSVNGGLAISAANGKIKSVTEVGTTYSIEIEGDMQFCVNDLIRCQAWSGTSVKYYWIEALSIVDKTFTAAKASFAGVIPAAGDDLVLMGNTKNKARQSLIYLSAAEDGKPRISILSGINTDSFAGKLKTQLGNLDDIQDSDFPADYQPSGDGLYSVNCFLKGVFILRNGKSIDGALTELATSFEVREGQVSSKVSEATRAASAANAAATNSATNAAAVAQAATRVTEKETSINQTAAAIELKAREVAVSANSVATKESAINQTAAGISLTVTDITKKANDATTAATEAKTAANAAGQVLSNVTSKETAINQTANSIELKAQEVTRARDSVTAKEAAINQTSAGINLSVSEVSKKASDAASSAAAALTAAGTAQSVLSVVNEKKSAIDQTASGISLSVTDVSKKASDAASSAGVAQGAANSANTAATNATNAANTAQGALAQVTSQKTAIDQTASEVTISANRAESAAGKAAETEARISVNADGIVMKAASTAALKAVSGVQIGVRNLLLKSNIPATNGGYPIKGYYYAEPLIVGEIYTIVVCAQYNGSVGGRLDVCYDGGYNLAGSITSSSKAVYSFSFVAQKFSEDASKYCTFYHVPINSTGTSTVHWAAVYKGNKVPQEWMEAPQEVKRYGANLLRDSSKEVTSVNEYLEVGNISYIFDQYGIGNYMLSFDLKVSKAGDVLIYSDPDNPLYFKYLFDNKVVTATTDYKRFSVPITVRISTITQIRTSLSFYGVYGTGVIPTVRNVQIEYGTEASAYMPSPDDNSASITILRDQISSKVSATDYNGQTICSYINQTAGAVKIKAAAIQLEGLVTANAFFKILEDGSMVSVNGTFTGKITATSGYMENINARNITIWSHGTDVFNAKSVYMRINEDGISIGLPTTRTPPLLPNVVGRISICANQQGIGTYGQNGWGYQYRLLMIAESLLTDTSSDFGGAPSGTIYADGNKILRIK